MANLPPPSGLVSTTGLKMWERHGIHWDYSVSDFDSAYSYYNYQGERGTLWMMGQLLSEVDDASSINFKLLSNLCKVLQQMSDRIDELEAEKACKESFW
jgi:hypothetical protein